MNNYKDLTGFQFWCQKVLPLVYDDSLSYYESLCKVVDYLNEMTENLKLMGMDITALDKAFTNLKEWIDNYFANLDLQEEVNIKLEEMVKNGTLKTLLSQFFNDIYAILGSNDISNIGDGTVTGALVFINDLTYSNFNKLNSEKANKSDISELSSGAPVIVDSTTDMTNKNNNYVLSSNQHIYSWVNGVITDSGLLYQPLAIGEKTILRKNMVAQFKLYNILPQDLICWDCIYTTTGVGDKLKYGFKDMTIPNEQGALMATDGYYGFFSKLLKINGNEEITMVSKNTGYRYAIMTVDENLIVLQSSGYVTNNAENKIVTADNAKYVIFAIGINSGESMPLSFLPVVLQDVAVFSETIKNFEFEKELNFLNLEFNAEQGSISNTTVNELPTLVPSGNRIRTFIKCYGANIYNFKIKAGYKIYLRDINELGEILTYSGWITSENYKHRSPTNTKYMLIVIAEINDNKLTAYLSNDILKIERLTENMNYLPTTTERIENTKYFLNKPLKIENISMDVRQVLNTGVVSTSPSSNTCSFIVPFSFIKDNLYKIKLNKNWKCLIWGFSTDLTNGLYTDWITGDSQEKFDNYDYLASLNFRKVDNSNFELKEFLDSGFNISIGELDSKTNFFESVYIAHRCGMDDAPENTIEALIRAKENGFNICEIDIKFTKDNVPIVFHDTNTLRMTNVNLVVEDATLEQIKSLTIVNGSHISDFVDVKIPTFEEMLYFAKAYNVKLYVDALNTYSIDRVSIVINLIKLYAYDYKCALHLSAVQTRAFRPINKSIYWSNSAEESDLLSWISNTFNCSPIAILAQNSNPPSAFENALIKSEKYNVSSGVFMDVTGYSLKEFIKNKFDYFEINSASMMFPEI